MKKLLLSIGLFGLAAPLFASPFGSVHPADLSLFIQSHHPLIYLAAFFGLGILLAFTPCVLPMVPILSGIITGQGAITGKRAWQISLAYVIGMSITYALAGMMAAYFGSTVQTLMQQPLILLSFSILFIGMALWLLDLFQLPLSMAIKPIKMKRLGLCSAALMGGLSTLIVSPCVTAPLIGVLTYIAESGHVLQGGILLFTLAIGMGLPLLIVGAGYGKLLPKAGPWMVRVKHLFAIMMVAMAVTLLGRILPPNALILLWAAFLVFTAFVLRLKLETSTLLERAFQGLAIFALMSAGALAYKGLRPPVSLQPVSAHTFVKANTLAEIHHQLALAKKHHQAVFIEFFASWCSDCQAMDHHVFNQPNVIVALQDTVNLRVSVGEKTDAVAAIKKAFRIYGIPTMAFYQPNGNRLSAMTSVGPVSQDEMLQLLMQLKNA